jgi:hypothetical protein
LLCYKLWTFKKCSLKAQQARPWSISTLTLILLMLWI